MYASYFLLGVGIPKPPSVNSLDAESYSNGLTMDSHVKVATPEEFVRRYGGCRVINKILIANNGIAGTEM